MGISLAQGAGISQGLAQGVQAYLSTRSSLTDEAIKKKLANVQGADAYAKLVGVMGSYGADPVAEKLGILPPGLVTGDSAQPTNSPGGDQETANQSVHAGAQAPTAPPRDETPQNQMAASKQPDPGSLQSFGLMPGQQSQEPRPVSGRASAQGAPTYEQWKSTGPGRYPPVVDALYMPRYKLESDPQAQLDYKKVLAEVQNAKNQPTNEATKQNEDDRKAAKTSALATTDILKQLRAGGEKTPATVLRLLPQVIHPENPRPGDIPEALEGSSAKDEILDYIHNKRSGDFSPKTKQAIAEIVIRLHQSRADDYRANANFREAQAAKMGGSSPGFTHLPSLDASDHMISQYRSDQRALAKTYTAQEVTAYASKNKMTEPETIDLFNRNGFHARK